MALKADRRHVDSDIAHFTNSVAERGGIMSNTATVSSGAAMDQSQATVAYVANPSGVSPLGVLMGDVVNLDLTRQHPNWHKEETQIGGKVTIWTKGTVVTDMIYPGHTPTPGAIAYVGHSGLLATSDVATDEENPAPYAGRQVGRFVSQMNEDGFAKVDVNLP